MNRVCLIGRLTTKPELRNGATSSVRFSIAVQRSYKNANGTYDADFINVVAFGPRAEMICNNFDKGNQIGVEGRIQTGSFTGQDGQKRYTTDVVIDQVFFVGGRNNQSQNTYQENQSYNNQENTVDYAQEYSDYGDDITSMDDLVLD